LISVGLFHYLYNFSISRTSVATAAILLYTAPAHVVMISAYVFREKLNSWKLAALGLTLAGAVLVSGGLSGNFGGDLTGLLAGLGSGLTYGLYSIFGKKAIKNYNSWTVLVYSFLFGAVFLVGFSSLTGGISLDLPGSAWPLLIGLGLFPTLLAYTLYLAGLKRVEASRGAIVATWEPVIAAILGYVVLGEGLSAIQTAGGGLVLIGVLLAQGRTDP
jgi:drug/metabolite transporter (DMT)-like permease